MAGKRVKQKIAGFIAKKGIEFLLSRHRGIKSGIEETVSKKKKKRGVGGPVGSYFATGERRRKLELASKQK